MHTHEAKFQISDKEAQLIQHLTEREYREYISAHAHLKRVQHLPLSRIGADEYANALDTVQRAVRITIQRMA